MTSITKIENAKRYPNVLKKMEENKLTTCEQVAKQTPKQLSKTLKVGQGVSKKIIEAAQEAIDKAARITKISTVKLLDPDMINRPEQWTLASIMDKLEDGNLTVPTDFQRKEFWSEEQKQDLIDSIAVGLTIPPLYVYYNEKKKCYEIIDGQQRVSSIRDTCNGEIPFMLTSPKAIEQGLDVLNGFEMNDVYQQNRGLYTQFMSRQIDVVIISGITREEVQDFYITLNASNSDMSSGELYYAIRGAFHSVLLRTRKHDVFSHIRKSNRRGDLEAVTTLLSYQYNGAFKTRDFKRDRTQNINQFRKLTFEEADNLYTSMVEQLDWCYNILAHVNYGNGAPATRNLVAVLLTMRESNPELDQEKMIQCLEYIFYILDKRNQKKGLIPDGYMSDFTNFEEYYKKSSSEAVAKTWLAVTRIFKGEKIWRNLTNLNESLY